MSIAARHLLYIKSYAHQICTPELQPPWQQQNQMHEGRKTPRVVPSSSAPHRAMRLWPIDSIWPQEPAACCGMLHQRWTPCLCRSETQIVLWKVLLSVYWERSEVLRRCLPLWLLLEAP